MLTKAVTAARLAALDCQTSGEEWDALLAEIERELLDMKQQAHKMVNGYAKPGAHDI